MEKVLEKLEHYASLSSVLKETLSKFIKKKVFVKGDFLLKEGEVCRSLYMMESGFARSYYFQNGKEITSWFGFENDVVASIYSFVTQKPSNEIIEILEHSSLYYISYLHLQYIYRKYPEFNIIGRLLTEQYYIKLEERILSLQSKTAKERYFQLLEENPLLLQKASLGHIASYLGISQETLSRIRASI